MGRKKDTTRRAPGKRAQLKLSDPRNVRRLRALYDGEDAGDLVDWVVQLVNSAGADERHPRVFPLSVRLAAEVVEAAPTERARREALGSEADSARSAYDHLADVLARTQAGETLAGIYEREEAERLARAQARDAEPEAPEPPAAEHWFDTSLDGLAELLVAVLKHPLTPVNIHTDIMDALHSLDIHKAFMQPSYIATLLRVSGVGQEGGE